tara:strand:+ start:131 stop:781 length:651 start_codon:yes stop_codon:yes gene_type:complete
MSELNFTHSNGNKVKLTTPDTLTANETFKLPGTDGTAGQVLTTDGNGNLSWIDRDAVAVPAVGSRDCLILGSTSQSAQTFSNLSETVVTALSTVRFNQGTMSYDSGQGRLTVNNTGLYHVHVKLVWNTNGDGGNDDYVAIRRNGSKNWSNLDAYGNFWFNTLGSSVSSTWYYRHYQVQMMVPMTSGQYIDITLRQNSGSNRTLQGQMCYWQTTYIG